MLQDLAECRGEHSGSEKEGPISVEDTRNRPGYEAIIDMLGARLPDLPESNQISFLTCNPDIYVKLIHGKCIPVRQEWVKTLFTVIQSICRIINPLVWKHKIPMDDIKIREE